MTDYESSLLNENGIKLLEPFKGAKQHHRMMCLACNHEWIATPISKRQALKKNGVSGCPACNANRRESVYKQQRAQHLNDLAARNIVILDPDYDGRLRLDYKKSLKEEKIRVKNTLCGHEFLVTPLNLIQSKVECGVCGPLKRTKNINDWSRSNSIQWKKTASEWQVYKSTVTSLTEQVYQANKDVINPLNLPRGKAGVAGAYHLDHIVPKRFCFEHNIPADICADRSNLQMMGWRENVGSRDKLKNNIPPVFWAYLTPDDRRDYHVRALLTMFPEGEPMVKVSDDVVATMYIRTENRAVIVLSLDQSCANKKQAYNAMKSLERVGIASTIIFEDELNQPDMLSRKVRHYLKNNDSIRVHARDCIIKPCSLSEKRELLDRCHVQGDDTAVVYYGAYFEDRCVAVMTFSPPRIALGHRKSRDGGLWELSRFCTDDRYRVTGIASKLLTHFKRNHLWKEIYSYADRRWSVGNLYKAIGFDQVASTPPNYFYVINGERKHRWNYRKDQLSTKLANFDDSLTEYQNMENHGFWRVWDCGSLKFSMINKSM